MFTASPRRSCGSAPAIGFSESLTEDEVERVIDVEAAEVPEPCLAEVGGLHVCGFASPTGAGRTRFPLRSYFSDASSRMWWIENCCV